MSEQRLLADAGISSREADVLALLGERLTNAEISSRLYISVRTVESHVSALLRKLGAADRRALAELAFDLRAESIAPPSATRSPAAPTTAKLPSPLTSFVGRTAERAALAEALRTSRLVSAVGPGGVGKTRLALAVTADLSDQFADGAWYVDLVPVTDAPMVASAVATALGLGESARLTPEETVVAGLAERQTLLVLDNCEHVLDGVVPFVERILADCPGLTVLATSRARLVVPFEQVFVVPGLSVGDGDHDGDAVALFLERAGGDPSLHEPDQLAVVGRICAALGGLALAIELAAARLPALGLDGLQAGLVDQLRLLTGGRRAEDRHRSLRAALDWSYALLEPAEQAVLRRAAVFAAPFTADAAARVAASEHVGAADVADALGHLAEKSLLTVTRHASGTRYRMLEPIRQYGEERLAEAGEDVDAHARHLHWCIAAAERLEASRAQEPSEWRNTFDEIADDLRASLGWVADQPVLRADGSVLGRRLAALLFRRGMPSEAQRRFEQTASLADGRQRVEALALAADAAHCRLAGDDALRLRLAAADAAEAAGEAALASFFAARAVELIGRFPGLMSDIPDNDAVAALFDRARAGAGDDVLARVACEVAEAVMAGDAGEDAAQLSHRAELSARAAGDLALESAALDQLTIIEMALGNPAEADACTRRRIELLMPEQDSASVGGEINDAIHMAVVTSIAVGDLAAARRFATARTQLPFFREERDLTVDWLIVWAALAGEFDDAVRMGDQFRTGWIRAGRPPLGGIGATPHAMAMVHGIRGDLDARAEWLDMHTIFRSAVVAAGMMPSSEVGTFYANWFNATVLLHHGDLDAAQARLADDPESLRTWHTAAWRPWYTALWAEAAVLAGGSDAHDRVRRARPIVASNPITTAIVDRAEGIATDDAELLTRAAGALDAAGCRYQWARTLVLAGGDRRVEGEAALAAMGATPGVSGPRGTPGGGRR